MSFEWDWMFVFQALGALGSLATFGAFLALFKKDKTRDQQLDRLTTIAETLKIQNESLKKQNELLEQQIILFRDSKILQGQDKEALKELVSIENKRLRLSAQPQFRIATSGWGGDNFQLRIHNDGEQAIFQEISFEGDIHFHIPELPKTIHKNGDWSFEGHMQHGLKNVKDAVFKIKCTMIDKLSNSYRLEISRENQKITLVFDEND